MRTIRTLMMVLALTTLLAAPVAAQTPPEACAADSLYLISPDDLDLRLQEVGRHGITLSWPELDLLQSTCFTVRGVDTLTLDTEVNGGFGDRVDRVLRFTVSGNGEVGANQANPLAFVWRNEGPSTYGNLGGEINLTNNGGVVTWDENGMAWGQLNDGLPRTWKRTNIVAFEVIAANDMYMAATSGVISVTDPEGLYHYDGTSWTRMAPEIFGDLTVISDIAVDSANPANIAVATSRHGLFVSNDGAQTFTQWTVEFDPTYDSLPAVFRVRGLDWADGRLIVALGDFGVFISNNGGLSFTRSNLKVPDDLDREDPAEYVFIDPVVTSFVTDPSNTDRILATLQFHGVYETIDGGATWHDLYGDLVVRDPDNTGAWVKNGIAAAVSPIDPQVIVLGVEQVGLFRTTNGGVNWTLVGGDFQPKNLGTLRDISLTFVPDVPGRVLAVEDEWKVLISDDAAATWDTMFVQPTLVKNLAVDVLPGSGGNFILASWGGGIFVPGTTLVLSDTYTTETSEELRDLELGLDMTLTSGTLAQGDAFDLVCQTFQGWAVWRSTDDHPDDMILVGLYDRVNPESCIEGWCGNENFEPIPLCFAAKRAACFNFETPDTVRFFDEEIYNGFAYHYSVSAFDYGNTALLTPANNTNSLLFSPRWLGDTGSPFQGEGVRRFQRIIFGATAPAMGDEIYVFPNPLRNGVGIPGEEGKTVVFTNLPPESSIRVFTTAGDDVAALPTELQEGGQIRWQTRNDAGEEIAPGVYLYKVSMPSREAYWGRLVVIR